MTVTRTDSTTSQHERLMLIGKGVAGFVGVVLLGVIYVMIDNTDDWTTGSTFSLLLLSGAWVPSGLALRARTHTVWNGRRFERRVINNTWRWVYVAVATAVLGGVVGLVW